MLPNPPRFGSDPWVGDPLPKRDAAPLRHPPDRPLFLQLVVPAALLALAVATATLPIVSLTPVLGGAVEAEPWKLAAWLAGRAFLLVLALNLAALARHRLLTLWRALRVPPPS